MKGSGEFEGTIIADRGKIGGDDGWNITTNTIQKEFNHNNVKYLAAL
jgi:hypothetical protein